MIVAALLAAAVITSLWWRQWCLYEASIARHAYVHRDGGFGAEHWRNELTAWPRVRNTQA